MSHSPEGQRSDISCHSCRKRKVKCDRTYPHCLVCEQTLQPCTYPPGPQKPGPKIGSLRHRKRPRNKLDDDPQRATAVSWLEAGTESRAAPASDALNDRCVSEAEGEASLVTPDGHDVPTTAEAKALDLSFILHPAHEPSPSNKAPISSPAASVGNANTNDAIQRARAALGIASGEVEGLITAYFDNMVAISLFHQPSFSDKLARIASPTQAAALLAAMFAFAVRFSPEVTAETQADTNRRATHFLDLAVRYIFEALGECGDSTPPLCLLQACVVVAHCQLTQGVLGRAWRMLGTCVRLAYEMNLHLVDVRSPKHAAVDVEKWCDDEEKRRAWWAIWEMDVFATTIRRTPTAVDWSQIETLLPVEDEHWFQRKPQPSCYLEQDPIRRWKALESCGNQSPKAWFIVINSLMKQAQRISSPRGIPSRPQSDHIDEARQRLEIIANAVRCFQLALPTHLKYNQQYLGFDARRRGQATSTRQAHCSIYNIYVMTHLSRLMIYRYDVFKGRFRVSLPSHDCDPNSHDSSHTTKEGEHLAVKEYFDAADKILDIVHRSSDDHVRYINPFLSSTIWLASAVHLMRSQLCRPGTLKSVLKSRYEVLHLTYKKCVRFWDMHPAVQQSLETLEEQLEACKQAESQAPGNTERNGGSSRSDGERTSPVATGVSHAANASIDTTANEATASFVPNQGSVDIPAFPTPPQSHRIHAPDWQTETPVDVLNTSIIDLMPLQSIDAHSMTSQLLSSATLLDPMFLFGTNPPQVDFNRLLDMEPNLEWEAPRLDLQDML